MPQTNPKPSLRNYGYALSALVDLEQKTSPSGSMAYSARGPQLYNPPMWFYISLLALLMVVTRRSTEKSMIGKFDGLAMTWLQQAFALPFIGLSLFFAPFLLPGDLSVHFWGMTILYVLLSCVDMYFYFRALGMADMSHVAPLMSLVSVGKIVEAYLVLGQKPSVMGIGGVLLIVGIATVIHRSMQKT